MHTPTTKPKWQQRLLDNIVRWFDSEAIIESSGSDKHINWVRCIPFFAIHLGCLGALWTGVSTAAIIMCLAMFWLRMFAITAFYHRYFAHKSYKTTRGWQFVFAVLGNTAAQRGPLWWASHHRKHHKYSDQPEDIHSPIQHGFLWSHLQWFTSEAGYPTDYDKIKDFGRYPELRFLNRFDGLVPMLFACLMYATGETMAYFWPSLETSGWQMLIWGFFISTVLLFHATFTINSLGHIWGSRRFNTRDHSRNNPWLAFITLGEGWHNNHHRFAVSARQGFYWWELDISYMLLKMMSWVGIVSDLNPVPERILKEGKGQRHANQKGTQS